MELSARQTLLNSFLEASHGKLQPLGEKHARALQMDPLLYGHLSRWYQNHGSLRDHQELFGAHLLRSPDADFREHAKVLVQTLRPYQMARMVRYSKEVLKNSNRSLKSAVNFYLKRREADALWFDECVLRDRRSMRYLYATMHVKPGQRAQQVLFAEKPPADSRLRVVRQLHSLRSQPRMQAELIKQYRIQFTTALGAAGALVPELLDALVSVMTPQQLINNLGFLQRRGALQVPALRAQVMEKIQQGKTESRVHDAKSLAALKHLQPDEGLRKELMEMSQTRLRARGSIIKPTALLVDKSGSMEVCVEIGKMLACLCSTIAEAPLYVEAFDADSFTVNCSEPTFEAWERAFRHIRADGCTSIGAPLAKLRNRAYEQVLLISDGVENTRPFFCEELKRTGRDIEVVWLKVGGQARTKLDESAERLGVPMRIIPFNGDYYNLPNLVPMLCSRRTLVSEVLEYPLYQNSDLECLPPGFCPKTYEIL
ncbi:hypothetical protein JST97_15615 [bacterium]|nr:hypothetical protein [bacterium]